MGAIEVSMAMGAEAVRSAEFWDDPLDPARDRHFE